MTMGALAVPISRASLSGAIDANVGMMIRPVRVVGRETSACRLVGRSLSPLRLDADPHRRCQRPADVLGVRFWRLADIDDVRLPWLCSGLRGLGCRVVGSSAPIEP